MRIILACVLAALASGCATAEQRREARAAEIAKQQERQQALANVEAMKANLYRMCAADPNNVPACSAVARIEAEQDAAKRDRWMMAAGAGAMAYQVQQAQQPAVVVQPAAPPAPVNCVSTRAGAQVYTNCR